MAKNNSVQVGAVIDSSKAFDIYYEATGKPPRKIPEEYNTLYTPFEVDGQAALLIQQTGFERRPGEAEDDVNGLMVLVAVDAPDIQTGQRAIEKTIANLKQREARRSGLHG